MNTKFAIDDEVRLISNPEFVGIIKQVVSVLSRGNTLYLVDFTYGTKMVAEKDLEFNREIIKTMKDINLEDLSVTIEVEDKISEIIEELKLIKSDYPANVLINACRLQKYLVLTNSIVKQYIGASSNNMLYNELYNGLINGDRNYLTNSLIFTEVMKKCDAVVHNVAMKDKKGRFYVANLVLIDDIYYYFDSTLETQIFVDSGEDEEFILCCAGLGTEKYEKFFKPVSLLDYDFELPNVEIPTNIAKKDIDISLITGIK